MVPKERLVMDGSIGMDKSLGRRESRLFLRRAKGVKRAKRGAPMEEDSPLRHGVFHEKKKKYNGTLKPRSATIKWTQ